MEDKVNQLLRAVTFAAERHRGQHRKGPDRTPYINHVLEVAYLITDVGGVRDPEVIIAAVLHDTVEDTPTTFDELEAEFGRRVRELVEEMTDDKSLPAPQRKALQEEHAAAASDDAKTIKLADKISNVQDLTRSPPTSWSVERRREYVEWSARVIAGCRGANPGLESLYDEVLHLARRRLAEEMTES